MDKHRWEEQENQYIRENAVKLSDEKLAQEMSTLFSKVYTKGAVRKQRQRLQITKKGHRGFFKVIDRE